MEEMSEDDRVRNILANGELKFATEVTREDMNDLIGYDLEMCQWAMVQKFVDHVPEDELPKALTDERDFPWWIWLAREGRLRERIWSIHLVLLGKGFS